MDIIDTHLHLIDRTRHTYPWLAGNTALYRGDSPADYWAQARPLGIVAAIHMEVDVAVGDIVAEALWAANCGAQIAGVIAGCRPESANFPLLLDELIQIPKVRGLRRVLHTATDDPGAQPLFAQNLRRLAHFNLTFDLCVQSQQLPMARRLAQACPDVQFILDHCGNPAFATAQFAYWREEIAKIAALPNMACKISGIVGTGAEPRSVNAQAPVVEHCLAAFGWQRVIWGSDHPVSTQVASLAQWVAVSRQLVAQASLSEQAALFNHNARRIYRLAP